ncbi:MAG: polysaccharide export protein [Caulobacterales bacterium]|nr:polysaccharide export protein [Caulobacterales bacterium]
MTPSRRSLLTLIAGSALTVACGGGGYSRYPVAGYGRSSGPGSPTNFSDIGFSDWSDEEPEYLLYPGDQIDVRTPSAPELNQQLTVGPDGRISMPLVGHLMVADRSLHEVESALVAAYTPILRRPEVEVVLRQAGPLKVWVDGEVRTPGVYDMPGDIDAYQAVIMAGGFLPSGRRTEVGLIRRGPGGRRMMRSIDLSRDDMEHVALRRMDIIYVPRTTLAEVAVFFGQIREALPIGFTYAINGQYQQF